MDTRIDILWSPEFSKEVLVKSYGGRFFKATKEVFVRSAKDWVAIINEEYWEVSEKEAQQFVNNHNFISKSLDRTKR